MYKENILSEKSLDFAARTFASLRAAEPAASNQRSAVRVWVFLWRQNLISPLGEYAFAYHLKKAMKSLFLIPLNIQAFSF